MSDFHCTSMIKEEAKPLIGIKIPMESRKRKLDNECRNVWARCCVCGEINEKQKMAVAPKQKKVLVKWLKVFGPDILETCLINIRSNHYVCSIHWKQILDDWEGPIPEDLENASDEKSKAIMLLDSIDEQEAEDTYQKLQESRPSEDTEADNVSKRMKALTKCCVCGEIRQKHQMTIAPKQKKILAKWAQVFGPQFFETCTAERNQVNHYICSIHWDQLRDDWEGPLPEVLEKMKKENNGSFEVIMYLNDILEERNNMERKFTCRYCGAKCTAQNMTNVPTNELQLMKWAKRLGQQFLENVRKYVGSRICWSHFKHRNSNSRNAKNLPMTDEMMNEETNNYGFEKCRFCYVVRDTEEMVLVPENANQLRPWVEKLGSIFFDNVAMNSTNYICWSHFNLPDSQKQNYLKFLPSTKITQIEVEDVHEEVLIEKKEKYTEEIAIIEKEEKWDSEVQEKNDTLFEDESMEHLKICYYPQISTPYSQNSQNLVKIEEKPSIEVTKTKQCRYCETLKDMKLMTPVTRNPAMLSIWAAYLGHEFLDNVNNNISNYVCLSHFTAQMSKLLIVPEKENSWNVDEKDSEVRENETIKKSVIKAKTFIKSHYIQSDTQREHRQTKQCCYCGEENNIKLMRLVTQNPNLLSIWANHLGQRFLDNLNNNNISNFICLSHFCQGSSSLKYSRVVYHEKIQAEQEKYTKIRQCRYCNKPNDLKMMTPVTRDPSMLSTWAAYLGPEFLDNVNNNISNYICSAHIS